MSSPTDGSPSGAPSKSRVLVLSPFPPRIDGTHGGAKTVGELVVGLSRDCAVSLVHLALPDEPPIDAEVIAACASIVAVERAAIRSDPVAAWGRRLKLAAGLARGRPTLLTDFSSPLLAGAVQSVLRSFKPDLVQVEFPLMAASLPGGRDRRPPTVVTVHEPAARVGASRRLAFGDLARRIDQAASRRYERRVLAEADRVVVLSTHDQDAIAESVPSARTSVIPLGVTRVDQCRPASADPPTVLFVGNFIHAPNVDAARWLAWEIAPRLRVRIPDVIVTLVGDAPPSDLRAVRSAGLIVTGLVPSVRPYLCAATAVVAPVRSGGGMRVKVIEALAAGKALVATPLAVEGLRLRPGVDFLEADTTESLVSALEEVIRDHDGRRRLEAAAEAWATSAAAGEGRAQGYLTIYRELLDQSAERGGSQRMSTLSTR